MGELCLCVTTCQADCRATPTLYRTAMKRDSLVVDEESTLNRAGTVPLDAAC